jgi:hypothetical protein
MFWIESARSRRRIATMASSKNVADAMAIDQLRYAKKWSNSRAERFC